MLSIQELISDLATKEIAAIEARNAMLERIQEICAPYLKNKRDTVRVALAQAADSGEPDALAIIESGILDVMRVGPSFADRLKSESQTH